MQTREKQPFFKPLSNISATEMNNPSSLFESTIRQRSNQTKFNIGRQKENESVQEQTTDSEKLSSLHAGLHQEVDRIRKWKVQTEIEIKQKDKKIQEASQTVESLRKSILELQLQNESLSLKLQEEMGSREDILHRINATRDICNLLKEHTARTEKRLSKCESERTELKYMEKEHLKQFEELSQKFSTLEITARQDHERLTNLLNVERQEKEKIEFELKDCITNAEQKLKSLENQCEEKDLEIRDVRAELRKNEDKMHEITCHLDDYKTQLVSLQDDFNKKDSLLIDSDQELNKTKTQCNLLEDQISELTKALDTLIKEKEQLQQKFEESENNLNTQINCLTTELESCEKQFKDEEDKVKSLREQLEKALTAIEDTKSAKDMIIMEKSEMECQLNTIINQRDQLECEREENIKTIHEITSSLEEHKANLAHQKEILKSERSTSDELRTQINILETEKQNINDQLKQLLQEVAIKDDQLQIIHSDISKQRTGASCLNEEVSKLSQLLQAEKDKLNEMMMEKRNIGDELLCLQQELSEKDKELNSKHKDHEKTNKSLKKLESKLEECSTLEDRMRAEIQELKAELEIKISEIDNLKENQDEQDKMLNGELEVKAKEASALDNKVKTLKETVTAKTKQIKELEKEMRSLKSKLTGQSKESETKDRQLEELNEEFKTFIQEKQELESQFNDLKNHAEAEKKSADEARKEEKKMKKQSEKALKEKEETVQKCEHQIAEMMATLEKYQQENTKIVAQKDKEIEEMKNVLEQNENRAKMEANEVVADLNKQLTEMAKEIQSASGEKASADKQVSKLEKKIKKYENDMSKMEAKVKNLQEIVDNINSKKMENIGVQVVIEEPKTIRSASPFRKTADYSRQPETHKTTPNIRVAPKTPQMVQKKMNVQTPAEVECTPVLFKTPISKTPSSVKTPTRSILKSTDRNSGIKKRRVAFESDGSDSDGSSSSELMEVEIGEINSRFGGGQKTVPLHVRPSPKVKTPEQRMISDDEDDHISKNKLTLQRKPRGPPVTKTPKQESRVHISSGNKENINSMTNAEKPSVPRTPNIRKTPSKPPGKFFKSSPKDRPSQKAKQKEETWFDIDSVFGFED